MNANVFKAYDVRGVYPSEINEEVAYAVGMATAIYLKSKTIAVGRDARESSSALFEALAQGLTDAGCNVIDLGLLTTPMVYFAAWNIPEANAVVSVTASHNPPQYNGFKIALKGAIPVGDPTGLRDIRDLALGLDTTKIETIKSEHVKGLISSQDIRAKYLEYFASFANFGDKKFKVVIDTANAMGILELDLYRKFANNLDITVLYDDLDHPFTVHEANPMKTETLDELRAKVVELGADLGIAYDGDADRIGFVDETGSIVPMDLAIGLLAKEALAKHPGSTVFYDLRSSKAVKEVIEEAGGIALECPVGSPNIKRLMRDNGQSFFGGEGSGHYFFQENSFSEGGSFPAILLLNRMTKSGQKLSQLVADLRRYHHSGEINSEVPDKDRVLAELKARYADGEISEMDGLKISYQDWWFSVRASNTEPLLRLNLEADTQELMQTKRDELLAIIRK